MTGDRTNIARNEPDGRDRDSDARRAHITRSASGTVSSQRLEQIRERLREGAYDSAAVLEATARAIIGSGDIE